MQNSSPNKPVYQRIFGLDEIGLVAQELLAKNQNHVLLLQGEMGTGKTTLIKAICEELGVEDEVNSPTFALVNEYRDAADEPIYHFDLYRLNDPEEALDFGLEEYLESRALCLVEWPEKISKFLPRNFGLIRLEVHEKGRMLAFYPDQHELTNYPLHE